jgi:hypothetical protein
MAKRKELTVLDAIRDLKHQDPFVAFRIVLSSGDKYLIERPENLVEMTTQFFYASPSSDWFVFIRINQIAAVEHVEQKTSRRRKAS